MDGKHQAVIIDNGSYRIRAGLAGDDEPKSVFPSMVGRPKDGSGGEFIGANAQAKLDALNTKSPIEKGVVTNWEDMEKIWDYVYTHELKMKSSDLPAMLTERPLTPKANREKMAEIMFEKFKVPSLFSGIQGVLALYATGRLTGLSVDSGEEVTHAVPVFSGYAIPDGIVAMDVGGKHVTQCLSDLLKAKGQNLDLDVVRQIKETLGYVAADYEAENKKGEAAVTKSYTLPDGKEIKLGREAYECTEMMFNPAKCGHSGLGLKELVQKSVSQCEVDVRKEMLANTVLVGGNTMFSSLSSRLKEQLSSSVATPVKMVATKERERSVWIGASILGAHENFKQIVVTQQGYQERGAAAIHKSF